MTSILNCRVKFLITRCLLNVTSLIHETIFISDRPLLSKVIDIHLSPERKVNASNVFTPFSLGDKYNYDLK